MKVKFKLTHPKALPPEYAHPTDAAMDLVAVSMKLETLYVEYDTGLSIELPENHVALLFPRSSISNTNLTLCNSCGVIDPGYSGSIKGRFRLTHPGQMPSYKVGDRILQMIILPYPRIELEEVDKLSDSLRGTGGFGSSDSKFSGIPISADPEPDDDPLQGIASRMLNRKR